MEVCSAVTAAMPLLAIDSWVLARAVVLRGANLEDGAEMGRTMFTRGADAMSAKSQARDH